MRKIVLTFGLIAGLIMSVMFIITFQFHDKIGFENTGLIVGYTSMILAFLMIYFGVRSYRDNVAHGTVSFGRAFKVGILIALLGSGVYVATWEVIYFKFAPDFMDKYNAHVLEKAKQSGESEAQLAKRSKEMAEFAVMYKNPLINAAFTLLEPLPVGLLVTLVTAGVLSRKRRESEMGEAAS